MKLKEIIGAILMVILTISGVLLTVAVSVTCNINSEAIVNSMTKSDYLNKTEEETKLALKNYLSEEKLEEVFKNISIKSDIKEIANAMENGTVKKQANAVKEHLTNEVISVIDENVDEKSKNEFAKQISDTYIKTIFPVTEFDLISSMYNKYSDNIQFITVILAVIIIGIYIFLACSQKTYKWNIISAYNVIFINIMLVVFTFSLNDIVIGNIRTTSVINQIITGIRMKMILITVITLVIAILSNYVAYFRHKKSKNMLNIKGNR